MLCHGNGDLTRDGCCYVAGQVCPLRLKLANGNVYDAAGTNLGTVAQVATAYGANKPQRDRVTAQLQGVTYLCRAVVEIIAADPSKITDRPALEAAWHAHPDYVSQVRPAWAQVEQNLGLAPGAYNCGTWKGTGTPQCCFAETQTENDTKAARLSADGLNVRQRGGQ